MMGKAFWIVGLVIVLTIALVGCALNPMALAIESTPTAQEGQSELPLVTKLLVGTFRLEGTLQAIDATQAGTLLPLWKAYRALSAADTVTPAELSALAEQIEETLASAQRDAITAMNLTQADVSAVAQQQGVEATTASAPNNTTSEASGTQQPPAGDPMAGGGPGDLGGGVPDEGPGGVGLSGGPSSTDGQAAGDAGSALSGGSSLVKGLLDALIELLEARIAATGAASVA